MPMGAFSLTFDAGSSMIGGAVNGDATGRAAVSRLPKFTVG
jgi:hypothetical protein